MAPADTSNMWYTEGCVDWRQKRWDKNAPTHWNIIVADDGRSVSFFFPSASAMSGVNVLGGSRRCTHERQQGTASDNFSTTNTRITKPAAAINAKLRSLVHMMGRRVVCGGTMRTCHDMYFLSSTDNPLGGRRLSGYSREEVGSTKRRASSTLNLRGGMGKRGVGKIINSGEVSQMCQRTGRPFGKDDGVDPGSGGTLRTHDTFKPVTIVPSS